MIQQKHKLIEEMRNIKKNKELIFEKEMKELEKRKVSYEDVSFEVLEELENMEEEI